MIKFVVSCHIILHLFLFENRCLIKYILGKLMKISEIAELSGVSIGTVDRVIHNRGRVAPDTKKKIDKIIKDSGYKPNIIASNLKRGKTLKIGVLIPLLSSEGGYWEKCYGGIKKAINEISAFSVEIITKEFDRMLRGDLLSKGEELIESNIDVLAFSPIVQSESYQLINLLNDKPYAFFDSPLSNTNPITENIQDPYKAGICAARVMELFKPGKKTFISLQMHSTAYNLQRRQQGFIDYFKDKDATVIPYIWSKDNDQLFYSFIDSLFIEIPNIDGIFMTNATTGILSDYLSKKNLEHYPSVVGFDILEKNIEQLEKGNIKALISQQPEMQGYNTMQDIFKIKIMKRADTVTKSPIPILIILKENIPE